MSTTPSATDQKARVRGFWRKNPAVSSTRQTAEGTPEFYAEVERTRDELDPYIARFADFEGARDKQLLEIGVGLGTDFIRFVRAGRLRPVST